MEYQSAKVCVIDFHFSSEDKESIGKKKVELDRFFDDFLLQLKQDFGDPVDEIFLRKH